MIPSLHRSSLLKILRHTKSLQWIFLPARIPASEYFNGDELQFALELIRVRRAGLAKATITCHNELSLFAIMATTARNAGRSS